MRRVALPLARPALAAGVALAVMEALADFGAVNLLGYRALTDAIYRVWYGTFDQAAALQLATVLLSLALTLLALERLLRGRARYHPGARPRRRVQPRRLHGPLRRARRACCMLLLRRGVRRAGHPAAGLVRRRRSTDGASLSQLARAAVNSLLLATLAAVAAVVAATVVAYGARARPTRTVRPPRGSARSDTRSPARSPRSPSTCRCPGSTAGSRG